MAGFADSDSMSLGQHAFWYLAGRVVAAPIGLVSLMVFTRLLSAEEYGRYSVAIAVAGLISGAGFQWIRQSLLRFGSSRPFDSELYATLGTAFVGTTIVCVVVTLGIGLAEPNIRTTLAMVLAVSTAQAWYELAADTARVNFMPIRYSLSAVSRAGLALLLGAGGAMWLGSEEVVLWSIAVSYLLASLIPRFRDTSALFALRNASRPKLGLAMRYGFPLSLTLATMFLVDSSDRLMIAWMRTEAEAGSYAAAYDLTQFFLGTLMAGVSLGAQPLAVRAFESGSAAESSRVLSRYLVALLVVGGPGAVILMVVPDRIGMLVLGNYDQTTATVITIVAMGITLAALRSFYFDFALMLHQRTGRQFMMMVAIAIVNVLLNFALIPRWGGIGAAWATLVAFAGGFVLSWTIGRQFVRTRGAGKDVMKVLAALVIQAGVLVTTRGEPGAVSTLAAVVACGLAYVVSLLALNVLGARQIIGHHASRFARRKGLSD